MFAPRRNNGAGTPHMSGVHDITVRGAETHLVVADERHCVGSSSMSHRPGAAYNPDAHDAIYFTSFLPARSRARNLHTDERMAGHIEKRSGTSGPHPGGSILRGRIRKPIGPGSVLCERYVLEDALRCNRLGTVYRARDRVLSSEQGERCYVAVQLLPAQLAGDELLLERCKRSFARMRSWSHDNLIQVFSFERDGEQYFLTLEHVEGESLRWILDELRPDLPSHDETRAIIAAAGSALSYLSARGNTCTRVTGDDVLITHDYQVKLINTVPADFGNDELSAAGFGQGEDVYALACLAYELFTGRNPSEPSATRTRHGRARPRRAPGLSRSEWKALRGVLVRRADRPLPTMQAFLASLGLTGTVPLPAAGAAPAPAPRQRDRISRKSWAAVAAAIVVAALVATAGPGPLRDALEPHVERSVAALRNAGGGTAQPAEQPAGSATPATGAGQDGPVTLDEPAVPAGLSAHDDDLPQATSDVALSDDSTVVADDSAPAEEEHTAASAQEPPPSPAPSPAQQQALPAPDHIPSVPVEATPSPGRFSFATTTATVRESQGYVPLTIERRGGSAGQASFIWWTSDGTAVADEDYIDLGARVESLEDGERERTIFIPLVVDSIPGDRKTFHVHLGEGSGAPLGDDTSITVVVIDDS
jgi:hypothetical protein